MMQQASWLLGELVEIQFYGLCWFTGCCRLHKQMYGRVRVRLQNKSRLFLSKHFLFVCSNNKN